MQATQLPSLRQSLCRSSLVKPSQQAACQSRSCQPVWQKSRRQAGLVRAVADDSTDTFDGNDVVSSYRAAGPPVDQDPAEASPRCTEVVTPEVMQPVLLGQRGHSRIRRAATWTGRAGLTLLAAAAFPGNIIEQIQGKSTTLEALGVLTVIITIHECGHFLAARLQNIHIKEFAVGFGPKLFSYKGPDNEYCLRAIPLGGFVSFPDDDPDPKFPKDDPDLLSNRPIRDRAIVISAGVIANVIFAWSILFAQATTIGMAEPVYQPGVRVPEVSSSAVAARAGLKPGDIILRIAGKDVPASTTAVARVVRAITDSPERSLMLGIQRGEQQIDLPVTPALGADGSGRIGVQLTSRFTVTHTRASSISDAAYTAAIGLSRCFGVVLGGLWQIVSNFAGAAGALSGPVAIVAVGADAAKADSSGLFQFAALVNVNLAIVNILPLPALDGGYLALLAVEGLRGKKLPKGLEQGIMASGIVLLMGLGVVLLVRDTINLGGLG